MQNYAITDAVLLNNAPFEGDTLFKAGQLDLTLSIYELFKDASEPIQLKKLSLDNALLNIQINEAEQANYDIAKEDSEHLQIQTVLTVVLPWISMNTPSVIRV